MFGISRNTVKKKLAHSVPPGHLPAVKVAFVEPFIATLRGLEFPPDRHLCVSVVPNPPFYRRYVGIG